MEQKNSSMPGYIQEFEGLRGLMAFWVVLGHICNKFGYIYSSNLEFGWRLATLTSIPVYIFICLSGFSIFTLLGKRKDSYLVYISGRFFRIFPVYIVVLFFAVVSWDWRFDLGGLAGSNDPLNGKSQLYDSVDRAYFKHLFYHLLLLQGVVPNEILHGASASFLGPAWSLSLEWQFYIVAPLLFALFASHRISGLFFLIALICVDIIFSEVGISFMYGAFLANNIGFFAAGIGGYFLAGKNIRIFLACTAIAFAHTLNRTDTLTACLALFAWLIALYLFVFKLLQPSFFSRAGSKILLLPPVVMMGKLSFSVYLFHVLVIDGLYYVLIRFNGQASQGYIVMLLFSLSVVAIAYSGGYLLHKYIELVFMKMGRRLQNAIKG